MLTQVVKLLEPHPQSTSVILSICSVAYYTKRPKWNLTHRPHCKAIAPHALHNPHAPVAMHNSTPHLQPPAHPAGAAAAALTLRNLPCCTHSSATRMLPATCAAFRACSCQAAWCGHMLGRAAAPQPPATAGVAAAGSTAQRCIRKPSTAAAAALQQPEPPLQGRICQLSAVQQPPQRCACRLHTQLSAAAAACALRSALHLPGALQAEEPELLAQLQRLAHHALLAVVVAHLDAAAG